VAVAAGFGAWAVIHDETVSGRSAHHIRAELLAQTRPRPGCPNAPGAPRVPAGQTELSVLRIVDHCLAYRSEVVATGDVDRRLAALRADPGVVAADVPAKFRPTRPVATKAKPVEQWALDDLRADAVRELWPAGADVKVAIVDSGVDDHNLDLAGQVIEHAPWAHLYHGDYEEHGTHVAGIIAAKDDGNGALGLTPGAKLIDAQYYDPNLPDNNAGPSHELGEYLRWAIDHGADVLNMSLSGPALADTTLAALTYAEQAGVVAVAAAGNCGDDDFKKQGCTVPNQATYPAAYDTTVLSVASYDEDDHRQSSFSTANASVDIAAPGNDIQSDCPTFGKAEYKTCSDRGTSMATPYVSAAAALLRARRPDASPAAIREALLRSTRDAPGHPAGVHSDEFGTGLLNPVAAAAYLDQHAGQETPTPTASPKAVGPDTIVAGFITRQHTFELATAGGTTIPVTGVTPGEPGEAPSALAFSRDGAWFAASDGHHITFVDVASRRQDTVGCECSGVAFNGKGQLVTAEGNVLAFYEPATASRLRGVGVHAPTGGTFLAVFVAGASGDVTVVRGQVASAGSGAYAVQPDGRSVLLGTGPDPGVTKIVVSDDGRWVAWAMLGVCLQPTQIGVTDLTRPTAPASIRGPLKEGQALNVRFDGDDLVVGWAPMKYEDGGCGYPPWPPVQSQTRRPQPGTGKFLQPAPARWTKTSDPRRIVQAAPSGQLLYTQALTPENDYSLWFGGAPGGGSDVQLSPDVVDVVGRPLG
jgi:subtilisin family serine protease